MKKTKKRLLSMLLALTMLFSVAPMMLLGAYATGENGEEISERVSFVFLAEDIKLPYGEAGLCDTVVEDPDSAHGKAVKLSYDERYTTGDSGLYNVMIYPSGSILSFYTCNGKEGKLSGSITSEQLQENAVGGKYVKYTFSPVDMTGASFMYLFNCWGFQIRFTDEQLSAFEGKLLDVTVSLKVTGDVTNPAKSPAYYIDEVVVAECDPNAVHIHEFGDWQPAGEYNHQAQCTVEGCMETQTEAHDWGEAEVTKEATAEADGEMTYTCEECGMTRTKPLPSYLNTGSSNMTPGGEDQSQNQKIDPMLWIAIGLFAVSAVVVVIAVVILKKGKKG